MNAGPRIIAMGSDSDLDESAETRAEMLTDADLSPTDDESELYEDSAKFEDVEENSVWSRSSWIAPALAIAAVLGWTVFFGWVHRAEMSDTPSPQQWSEWIAAWATPVLLIATLWLLVMRNSRRETSRFGDAARILSIESAQLETRLITVNRELSLARDFIAAQSRDLDSLGRMATERLSEHAEKLAQLILSNGQQVDAIASVSTTALENMERLRGDLPVIANSARDVTNHIGGAGRTAHSQLDSLVSGFHRLNEFGGASERQVQSLRAQIDAALAAFEAQAARLGEIAGARFESLDERSNEFRAQLDKREHEALAAMRGRVTSLSAELTAAMESVSEAGDNGAEILQARITKLRNEGSALAEQLRRDETSAIGQWQAAIDRLSNDLREAQEEVAKLDEAAIHSSKARLSALAEETRQVDSGIAENNRIFFSAIDERRSQTDTLHAEALARIEEQLAGIDQQIAQRRSAHLEHSRELAEQSESLAAHIAEMGAQMGEVATQGGDVQADLVGALGMLGNRLAESRASLDGTDKAVAELTEASVRLLELIQASSEHSRELLPEAIGAAEIRLASANENVTALQLMLGQAEEKGRSLSEYVLSAQRDGRAAYSEVESLHGRFEERSRAHAERIDELQVSLRALADESAGLAERSQGDLRGAIETLREAVRGVTAELGEGSANMVGQLAARIGEESAEAIDRAVRLQTAQAIGQLEQSAAHASGVSREAAIQLRDQLAKVDELTGHLENRVSHARQRAEEQVDNEFARRVALITESLNSSSIDIAKALSSEVTDVAWASYLKGDRGIFTRRAVRLLDNSESRAVAQIYENDSDFRQHVSHYVHDFEAMLRQLLSTRDGHALSVTILSSDMGKLYVALAQAIERLRD